MRDLASKYIVIEGPIGVGKTSLSNKLALEWDADLILENVDEYSLKKAIFKIEKSYEIFKKNSSKIFLNIDNETTISNNLKKIKF